MVSRRHGITGKTRAAQAYPIEICNSILTGFRDQLTNDRVMSKTSIASVCCEEPCMDNESFEAWKHDQLKEQSDRGWAKWG